MLKDCPSCNEVDAIECAFALELDNVKLAKSEQGNWQIVDGTPGSSARWPEIGVETLETDAHYCRCRECGEQFDVYSVAPDLLARWSYCAPDRAAAISTAVEALSYALENDSQYLSAETIAVWSKALAQLNA